MQRQLISLIISVGLVMTAHGSVAEPGQGGSRVEFSREFAPSDGLVKGPEKDFRKELCLNGRWDFEPVYGPYGGPQTHPYGMDAPETAPDLPPVKPDGWDPVPLKVPSPWGASEEFPSYPIQWKQAEMGWLRKRFQVPADWDGRRIMLYFTAVGGDSEIFVNGQLAGTNFDQSLPFSFDVTDRIKPGAENEVLVGVRSHSLFNWQGKYGNLTSPPGGRGNLGIWQDVYLLGLPTTHVTDVYVKPEVSADRLALEVTIRNDSIREQTISLDATAREWINLAGHGALTAPEVKWRLGPTALRMPDITTEIPSGTEKTVTLEASVGRSLKFWSFDTPNLYGMVVKVLSNGRAVDTKYQRFGYREFKIQGKQLLLNGHPVQLLGDSQHLQNPTYMTRRFAWSWFKLLKDVGANAARLHAQVYPEMFHDMADEMGIGLLSESSIYASSCNINYDSQLFWKAAKYDVAGMVKKYRNHPSIYGWSVENEVLPALNVKCQDAAYKRMVYDGMGGLADICRELDSTRGWISGDGSKDMDGRFPVYNEHYGSTDTYLREAASTTKPYVVGEAGIAYYATPRQSSAFVGDRAYRSYADHAEAIAIDAYELLKTERQVCAFCSVWNVGYYGVEDLTFGMDTVLRPPNDRDGVWLTARYAEGKPGIQIERIPPYSSQYNPGYDPHLPLYKPLPLYYAVKAAYQPVPEPGPWDHRQTYTNPAPPVIVSPAATLSLLGKENGDLYFRLKSAGISPVMTLANAKVLLVDCATASMDDATAGSIKDAAERGAQVIFWGLTPENVGRMSPALPGEVDIFPRASSSIIPNEDDNRVASIPYRDMYFTDNPDSKQIMLYGMRGPLVEQGSVLLQACRTDWAKDNTRGMLRSLRENPAGPCLVELKHGQGSYLLSTINCEAVSPAHIRLLAELFRNLGVTINPVQARRGSLFNPTATLTRALVAGPFPAASAEAAFTSDYVGEQTISPEYETSVNGQTWTAREQRDGKFRFQRPVGAAGGAEYLSFYLRSPEPLNEIMTNPNVPEVDFKCGFGGGCVIWLNGQKIFEAPKSQADTTVARLPLVKGWNHFLIKSVNDGGPWFFSGRLFSRNYELLAAMESAFNPNSERANFYTISHTDSEIHYDPTWVLNGDGWYQSGIPGAKAVLKFYGTGVSLTGKVGPDGGTGKIYIDGKYDQTVDFHQATPDSHKRYYSKSGLDNGEHEVTVEVVNGPVTIGPYEQWQSYK